MSERLQYKALGSVWCWTLAWRVSCLLCGGGGEDSFPPPPVSVYPRRVVVAPASSLPCLPASTSTVLSHTPVRGRAQAYPQFLITIPHPWIIFCLLSDLFGGRFRSCWTDATEGFRTEQHRVILNKVMRDST